MTPEYDRIEKQLVDWLPELRPAVQSYWQSQGAPGEDAGPYILFEDLFRPYISVLLSAPESPRRSALLQRAFDVTEALIRAGGEVRNLAATAVFEGQGSQWFRLAQPFIGPRSRSEAEEYGWAVSTVSSIEEPIDLYGVRPLVAQLLAPGGPAFGAV